MNIYAEAQLLI